MGYLTIAIEIAHKCIKEGFIQFCLRVLPPQVA